MTENSNIIEKFVKSGLNPGKNYEFEFQISLRSKEDCVSARALFRKEFNVPEGGMFMVLSGSFGHRLMLFVPMLPSAEKISEIEMMLLAVAKNYSKAEVSWEFKE